MAAIEHVNVLNFVRNQSINFMWYSVFVVGRVDEIVAYMYVGSYDSIW